MKRYRIVNRLIKVLKPQDVKGRVSKHDIIEFTGPYCLILQTKRGCNNLCVFRINKQYSVSVFPIIMSFLRSCYLMHGIDYIRVNGKNKKYDYLCKYYKGYSSDGGNTYYFDLSEVIKKYAAK